MTDVAFVLMWFSVVKSLKSSSLTAENGKHPFLFILKVVFLFGQVGSRPSVGAETPAGALEEEHLGNYNAT